MFLKDLVECKDIIEECELDYDRAVKYLESEEFEQRGYDEHTLESELENIEEYSDDYELELLELQLKYYTYKIADESSTAYKLRDNLSDYIIENHRAIKDVVGVQKFEELHRFFHSFEKPLPNYFTEDEENKILDYVWKMMEDYDGINHILSMIKIEIELNKSRLVNLKYFYPSKINYLNKKIEKFIK